MNPRSQVSKPRMQDVKNTAHLPLAPKHTHHATHSRQEAQPEPYPLLLQQLKKMREALCSAIDENELLRDRVIELEALLAEAQTRLETYDEAFLHYLNHQLPLQTHGHRHTNHHAHPHAHTRARSL